MVVSARRRPPAGGRRLEPITIGPTWQRTSRGDWLLPKRTLGYHAIEWAQRWLQQPDGPDTGSPWRFTLEQARFLAHFYALEADGTFTYRRAVLRRMKGWGKDPLGAVICAIEFVGPCRFGGWESRNEPRAVPNLAAWVQTIGVAQDQTKNTMTLFPSLFSKAAIERYSIDIAKTLVYGRHGACRIEAITSAADTSEGNRPSFVLENEPHHYKENNGGHALDAVINRNLAKARDGSARKLAITNAHSPGEDSIAERDYEAYLAIASGRSRATGLLYDSLEAPAETDLDNDAELLAALAACAGDSSWVNPARLLEEIHDPTTSPADARRFYLNQIVAAEDAWLSPQEVVAAGRPSVVVPDGALVTLGLSGFRDNDSTALVACDVESGHIFTLGVWEAGASGVQRASVDAAVAAAFARFDVVGFYARRDPFQTWIEAWEATYGAGLCARVTEKQPIEFNEQARQARRTNAAEDFHAALVAGELTHDAHPVVMQHLINARRRVMTGDAIDIQKESRLSPRYIDGARAAIFARHARQDYLVLPESKKRNRRVAGGFFA